MRLALISDIHGNAVALDAVLNDIDTNDCDQIVCLGDAVQGGPQPVEIVNTLRDRAIPTVMGNSDDWLLTGFEIKAETITEEQMAKFEAAREWALAQLSDTNKDFINSFQPTITVELGNGQKLLSFHGSPRSYDDVLLPDSSKARFYELLPCDEATYFAGGHVHIQFLRHVGDGFHFNPGSAGAAYHQKKGREGQVKTSAEYAILDVGEKGLSLDFRRVPFDLEQLISIYKTSGRPYPDEAIASYLP